jgi:hypothetical protein
MFCTKVPIANLKTPYDNAEIRAINEINTTTIVRLCLVRFNGSTLIIARIAQQEAKIQHQSKKYICHKKAENLYVILNHGDVPVTILIIIKTTNNRILFSSAPICSTHYTIL